MQKRLLWIIGRYSRPCIIGPAKGLWNEKFGFKHVDYEGICETS